MIKFKTREDRLHKIETHVAGICIRNKTNPEILLLKRNATRTLYPGLWECGGGQVHENENFHEAIIRQMKEETALDIKIITMIGTYEITEVSPKIPGIKFLCEIPNVNQIVIINDNEHSEFVWVTIDKVSEFSLIKGIEDDANTAYDCFINNLRRTDKLK